ncbi:GatB/YqeY domain-containing protein [bacterium]|nr:GatB/YqeY domain-containing protein [bacterium]
MSLKERLTVELKEAMKSKEQLKLLVVRAVKSEIKYKEVELIREIDDNEILELIAKMIKTRKDSAEQYIKGGRSDVAEQELKEIELLSLYLPKQLTEDELKTLIASKKEELNISSPKEMGTLMKAVMAEVGQSADGKTVSKLVKELLS